MLFIYHQIIRFIKCIQQQIKIIIDYRFLIYFLTNFIIIMLGIENKIPLEKVVLYLLSSSVVILLISLYFCYKDFDHYIRGYARRAVEHDMRIINRLEAHAGRVLQVANGNENAINQAERDQ